MEFRAHGANPEKLYAAAGLPTPAKIYDFSTNTNAVPQRAGFVPDLRAALEDYPDDGCSALREALSRESARRRKTYWCRAAPTRPST